MATTTKKKKATKKAPAKKAAPKKAAPKKAAPKKAAPKKPAARAPVSPSKKPASKASSSKPQKAGAGDAAWRERLTKALVKENHHDVTAALRAGRGLPVAVRAETLLAVVARKSKSTPWVDFIRALGTVEAAVAAGVSVDEAVGNAGVDAVRQMYPWVLLGIVDELLTLGRNAGARIERVVAYLEKQTLASQGFLDERARLAVARGEDATAWQNRAARAPRVLPLVAALGAGSTSNALKAALVAVDHLDADDRAVFDELFCSAAPSERQSELLNALERLLTSTTEPHPTAIHKALNTLRWHEPLKERLAALVADGGDRVVARLALVLSDDASDDAQKPVLEVLRPFAGRPDIFALVERAFAAPGPLAGTLSSEWCRGGTSVWEFLSDAQQSIVVDGMIRADEAGISGAHHALFYISARGAEARIRAEVERIWNLDKPTDAEEKRFWSLVFALGHIGTDSAVEFVRGLAFDAVDGGIWECLSALGETLSEDRFVGHLAAACAAEDPARAHSIITSLIEGFIEKGAMLAARDELLVRTAQSAVPFASSSEAVFSIVTGIASAVRRLDLDAVRALSAAIGVTKAPTLASLPKMTSRFAVLRKSDLKTAFHDDDNGKSLLARWAAALDGSLDAELAKAKEPITGPITDERIGMAAGTVVKERLVVDADEVWFIGEDQKLHLMGRAGPKADPVFLLNVLDVPKPHLSSSALLDERVILWTKAGTAFIEAQRYGHVVFFCRGLNNGWPERHVLRFADDDGARAALALLQQKPPKGYAVAADAWFVDGHGGVIREYYVPKGDGKGFDVEKFCVVEGDDSDAGRAAAAEREAVIVTEGGTLKLVEWMERVQRKSERSFIDWFVERSRDDDKDVHWHLMSLVEAQQQLVAAGLPKALVVEVGPPATAESLAEVQQHASVPEVLLQLWQRMASLRVVVGDKTWRFFNPSEAREAHASFAPAVKASKAKLDRRLETSWPLLSVERGGEEQFLTVFDGAGTGGGARQFTNLDETFWQESLAWHLAVGFLLEVRDALLAAHPVLEVANVGSSVADAAVARLTHPSGKWWQSVQAGRAVGVRFGKAGSAGTFNRTVHPTVEAAAAAHAASTKAKLKDGYVAA